MKKNILLVMLAVLAVFAVEAQIPSYVPTNGLVGYWPFNGNANDESGNGYHGTVLGASLKTDRFGNSNSCYEFSGSTQPGSNNTVVTNDNVISVNNYNVTFLNQISISIWSNIYPSNNGGFLDRRTDNNIDFVVGGSYLHLGPVGPMDSNTPIDFNAWHHYVYLYDGTSLNIYIDGLLRGQQPASGSMNNSTSTMNFGKYVYHGGLTHYSFFNGKLDEIAIYNRALTPQEITALYNGSAPCQSTSSTTNLSIPSAQLPYNWNGLTFTSAGTQTDTLTNAAGCDSLATLNLTVANDIPAYLPTNGLVGYWPFNGNANDESGNGNNGTVNGATLTQDRFGNSGKAYSFNGIDNNITISTLNNLAYKPITYNAWINPNEFNTINYPLGGGLVIMGRDWSGYENQGAFMIYDYPPGGVTNDLVYYIGQNASYTTFTPELNKWTLVTMTISNQDTISYYVNGNKITSQYFPTNSNLIGPFKFGAGTDVNVNSNRFLWKGFLDDLSVYNRALTPQEIAALYTGSAPCQSTSSNTNLSIRSAQLPYNWNGLTFTAAGTQTDTLTNAAGCDSLATLNLTVANDIPAYLPTNGLVGYWPFNGNANDESGNGNNGTVNGATLTADRFGNSGKAYGFDGVNNRIVVPNSTTIEIGSNDYSLIAWIKTNSSSQENGRIISKGSSGCITGYMMRTGSPNSSKVYTENAYNFNCYVTSSSTEDINDDTWHLVSAVVKRNSGVEIYIDGLLDAAFTVNSAFDLNNGQDLFFGYNNLSNSNEPYFGSLDDIAIYNRALTPQEIAALYTGSAPCQSTSSNTNLSIRSAQLPYNWNGLTFTAAGTQTDTLTNAAGCDSLATLNLTVANDIPAYLPTNGLVGYWPFNGNANDESGNGNNGTVNGATLTADRFGNAGKAYGFDGVDDYITIQHSPTLSFESTINFTVSFYYKPLNQTPRFSGLISKMFPSRSSIGPRAGWQIAQENSFLGYQSRSGNSLNEFDNNACGANQIAGIENNNYNHCVAVFDRSNGVVKFYINNILFQSAACPGIIDNISNVEPLLFAVEREGWFYSSGILDDIAIYNRALSPQEISALYQAQSTNPSDTGTILPHDTLRVGINVTNPQRNLHIKDVMRLEPRNSPPANPAEGDIYYDGTRKKLRLFDGTNWKEW